MSDFDSFMVKISAVVGYGHSAKEFLYSMKFFGIIPKTYGR